MGIVTRQPILVGGLALTLVMGLVDVLGHSGMELGGSMLLGAIALVSGIWWLKQRSPQAAATPPQLEHIDRSALDQAIATVNRKIQQLTAEAEYPQADTTGIHNSVANFQSQVTHLSTAWQRTTLNIAVMGGKAVGKTALVNLLQTQWSQQFPATVTVQDTASLFTALEPIVPRAENVLPERSLDSIAQADVIIFVTAGDLTASEWQFIQQCVNQRQRVVVAFNKQDQYLPTDRPAILQQIRLRLQGLLAAADVVAIATAPNPLKVRQHQASGDVAEVLEAVSAEIAPLTNRLTELVQQQTTALVLATTWRQTQALQRQVQTVLNHVRRDRALPIVEKYQWITATAAFANPVPSLDVLATAAINTQLIIDLGRIYQQQISLEQAKTVASTLGSCMVKLGLVEVSTQALGALCKSHALTFVAGGLLQGISAAYLTQVVGCTLIDYFEAQSHNAPSAIASSGQLERLGQKLQAVFRQTQRSTLLASLLQQGIRRFKPEATLPASLLALPTPTAMPLASLNLAPAPTTAEVESPVVMSAPLSP